MCVCVRESRNTWGWADLCVSVYNWGQKENLWADICTWFLVIINQVSLSAGVLPHSSGCLRILHMLSLSNPFSFPHACGNPKTAAAQQSSCRTLDSTSLFGWPHELSCESSFLASVVAGEKEKSVKAERPALWLSASGGGRRQRGVNRPQPKGARSGKNLKLPA